jgi:predicted transcriptional regulator
MKLYTEKEIKKFMQKNVILDELTLSLLTPIELPSDEEIEEVASDCRSNSKFYDIETFEDGAKFAIKWMRDKIQGNEQQ